MYSITVTEPSLQRLKFKILVETVESSFWMYNLILCIAVAYILLCKLNCGYHNQAHFQ